MKPVAKEKIVSLGDLNERIPVLLEKGKIREENGMIIVDSKSGYGKVLGQGNIDKKVLLKIDASKGAVKKIEEAGGKFEFAKKGKSKADDAFDEDFEVAESEGVEE